jgi:hypothetical protein
MCLEKQAERHEQGIYKPLILTFFRPYSSAITELFALKACF